jgi:hypothetical protein
VVRDIAKLVKSLHQVVIFFRPTLALVFERTIAKAEAGPSAPLKNASLRMTDH